MTDSASEKSLTSVVLKIKTKAKVQTIKTPKNDLQSLSTICKINLQGMSSLSQPTLRREGDAGLVGASSKGGKCVESPPTFIQGKCWKNRKRCGLRTLIVKGSGVVFTHGEGISTPRVRHKGRQPLIKCVNMTSIYFISPFMFLGLFMPFVFFIFLWSTRVFPLLLRIP